jgi:hypothetical protein
VGVYSDAIQVNSVVEELGQKEVSRGVFFSSDFSLDVLLVQNYIPNLCFMVKKDLIKKAGGFDVHLDLLEDWEWLIRLAQYGKIKHLPLITCEYQVVSGGKSRNIKPREQIASAYYQIYSRYTHLTTDEILIKQKSFFKQMTGSDLTLSLDGKNMEFARDILKEILESDNVEDTIYKYAHILNKNILTVIEAEKRQALLDKDNDLVDGLDGLSGYISQIIMRGNH